jgi:hypothetical protein
MFSPRSFGIAVATAAWALSSEGHAAPPEGAKAKCASAYEQAQEHRAAGRLSQAREALILCAQRECPAFVQKDCSQWLGDVQRQMPSIVVAAKGPDGSDLAAVKVTMDGQVIATELDGTAIDVDPGPHLFRFEYENEAPIEQRIVVRQAQKDRVVEVRFGPEPSEVAEPTAPDEDRPPAPREPGPLRPYAYVAGGVGVAGLAGWGVFALLGKKQESDLEEECGGSCAESDVDSVKKKYLIADISLGVGIAGLGTGVLLFLISKPSDVDSSTARADLSLFVVPVAGGGHAGLTKRF